MTSAPPMVSVVMANYNGAAYLPAAVRSVLAQTLKQIELIIVDDRSTDASLVAITAAAEGDGRVRVLVQDVNGGPGPARNRGLDAARGRWIAVVDSDDLIASDRLQRLVDRGERDGADIVVDNLMVFGQEGPEQPLLQGRAFASPRWFTLTDYISSGRMYARRPGLGYLKPLFRVTALANDRYREGLRIGEDYDLVARLLARGRTMRLEPAALYRYRRHGASISHQLRRVHLLQMLAADAALDGVMQFQPRAARRAQAARRRSLCAALAYDDVIWRLKGRDLKGALAAALAAPEAWPLLGMPIVARIKRLGDRIGRRLGEGRPA